jgi:aminopeptidase YwaD
MAVDKDGSYQFSEVKTINYEAHTLNSFSLYPNPVKNNITIQLNENVNSTIALQITDIIGKILVNKNIVATNGLINVNASLLNNGTYFIRLIVNGETQIAKVVIEK